MKEWAVFPIRLGLGTIFILHGLQKAFGMFDGPGIAGFTKMLTDLGFPMAGPLAFVVAYVEFIGGIFLILGLFTRLSALLLTGVMLIAMAKVHLIHGFFLADGGYEYVLVILMSLFTLLLFGGGNLSMDQK
ncbi:MAG: DoxX family protein [Candidatus Omnitrophica bacterium]|nr:DoxX family protein [Candidatus Omnitrophota bacterium]